MTIWEHKILALVSTGHACEFGRQPDVCVLTFDPQNFTGLEVNGA
jgi:hypothetical protein